MPADPSTLMPELKTPPRRLSGAATRLHSLTPRAQVELKARVAAGEHGAILAQAMGVHPIPSTFAFTVERLQAQRAKDKQREGLRRARRR